MFRILIKSLPVAVLLLLGCGPLFKAPSVKVRGVDARGADELDVSVVFYNPNRFPIDIADLEYRVFIESLNCGAGRRDELLRLGGRDSTIAGFPLQVDYANLARSLPYLLNDSVGFRVEGDYRLPKLLGKRKLNFRARKKLALKARIDELLRGWFK